MVGGKEGRPILGQATVAGFCLLVIFVEERAAEVWRHRRRRVRGNRRSRGGAR
jgi:hypothetical protein